MTRIKILVAVGATAAAGIAFFGWPQLLVKAHEAGEDLVRKEAMEDLHGLHTAASKYVADVGNWPQMPEKLLEGEEKDFFAFWMKALKPYGATEEMWKHSGDQSEGQGSYIPTLFDARPSTPFRWEQPWFLARGSFGGQGVFLVKPDGSVINAAKFAEKEKEKAQ